MLLTFNHIKTIVNYIQRTHVKFQQMCGLIKTLWCLFNEGIDYTFENAFVLSFKFYRCTSNKSAFVLSAFFQFQPNPNTDQVTDSSKSRAKLKPNFIFAKLIQTTMDNGRNLLERYKNFFEKGWFFDWIEWKWVDNFVTFKFYFVPIHHYTEIARYPEGHETRKIINGCLERIEKNPAIATLTAKVMEPWFARVEKESQRKWSRATRKRSKIKRIDILVLNWKCSECKCIS